jgi:hypothetical protein
MKSFPESTKLNIFTLNMKKHPFVRFSIPGHPGSFADFLQISGLNEKTDQHYLLSLKEGKIYGAGIIRWLDKNAILRDRLTPKVHLELRTADSPLASWELHQVEIIDYLQAEQLTEDSLVMTQIKLRAAHITHNPP